MELDFKGFPSKDFDDCCPDHPLLDQAVVGSAIQRFHGMEAEKIYQLIEADEKNNTLPKEKFEMQRCRRVGTKCGHYWYVDVPYITVELKEHEE